MSRFKGFVRVASSFDPIDVRLAVVALEGVDIVAISTGVDLGNMLPHHSLAFGPMEVHVREEDAAEATALLAAIAGGTVAGEGTDALRPLQRELTRRAKIWNTIGYLWAGVAHPLRGLLVHSPRG